MLVRDTEFQSDGITLRGRWYEPEGEGKFPVVIFASGDGPKGSGGETWTNLVPKFERHGFGVFAFDFAGLGSSDGERRALTLSRGVSNFRDAMTELQGNRRVDSARIGALGASFGGNVVLLAAGDLPALRAIALKSPCSYMPEAFVSEFGFDRVERWRSEGYLEEIGFDYAAFLDPLGVSTYELVKRIEVPMRIVHGGADSVVPVRQSHDLTVFLQDGSLRVIEGADHWYAEGDEWEIMAEDLVDFLALVLCDRSNPA